VSSRSAGLVPRLVQLFIGLSLFGFTLALMVRAGLGLAPWDVLAQGISNHTGIEIGWIVIIIGAIVLLAWIPLRQAPGFGTVANVFIVGAIGNAALAIVPAPHGLALEMTYMLAGVLINGIATGPYIGAGLGPGPRDGLMTGWARRGRISMRAARTIIEVTVLVAGFALGGTVGLGTAVYALCIGPLAGYFIPKFTRVSVRRPAPA
jgi:uncharacterized membrane protein YczE